MNLVVYYTVKNAINLDCKTNLYDYPEMSIKPRFKSLPALIRAETVRGKRESEGYSSTCKLY